MEITSYLHFGVPEKVVLCRIEREGIWQETCTFGAERVVTINIFRIWCFRHNGLYQTTAGVSHMSAVIIFSIFTYVSCSIFNIQGDCKVNTEWQMTVSSKWNTTLLHSLCHFKAHTLSFSLMFQHRPQLFCTHIYNLEDKTQHFSLKLKRKTAKYLEFVVAFIKCSWFWCVYCMFGPTTTKEIT
jgi:hypothetical protein